VDVHTTTTPSTLLPAAVAVAAKIASSKREVPKKLQAKLLTFQRYDALLALVYGLLLRVMIHVVFAALRFKVRINFSYPLFCPKRYRLCFGGLALKYLRESKASLSTCCHND